MNRSTLTALVVVASLATKKTFVPTRVSSRAESSKVAAWYCLSISVPAVVPSVVHSWFRPETNQARLPFETMDRTSRKPVLSTCVPICVPFER